MILNTIQENFKIKVFRKKRVFLLSTLLVLLALAAGLGTTIWLSFQAHAAASTCSQPPSPSFVGICGGKSPLTNGCFLSATTLDSLPIHDNSGKEIGTVEIRFSKNCQTGWARVISFLGKGRVLEAIISKTGATFSPGQYSLGQARSSNLVFSGMVVSPQGTTLTACSLIGGKDGGGSCLSVTV